MIRRLSFYKHPDFAADQRHFVTHHRLTIAVFVNLSIVIFVVNYFSRNIFNLTNVRRHYFIAFERWNLI